MWPGDVGTIAVDHRRVTVNQGRVTRTLLLVAVLFSMLGTMASSAASPGAGIVSRAPASAVSDPALQRTWARTDRPVAEGAVSRTWMWGPDAFREAVMEDYNESPGGVRKVQYFDKSRMEITNPGAHDDGVWYVTNGLLVVELMTGRMQVGNDAFVDRAPASVNVAGDPDDPLTYAVLGERRGDAPLSVGSAVTQRIDASGEVTTVPELAGRGVTAATHVAETNHTVASVFWDFMHATGPVYRDGQIVTDGLFQSAFYATGLPVTEAFWAQVKVGGTPRDVLLQCFERRCLTYTPDNDPAWQVEAGNVGQHYYRWRYGTQQVTDGPSATANALARKVKSATNAEERYAALLEVMSHLNVGVYAGDGTMIVGGAERGAADFYVYDFELRMMAGALGRGETWGVADLAMQFTAMGLLQQGEILDPLVLRQAILSGVNVSRHSAGDFTSLSPLLLRQLGLYSMQPYDLFASPALGEMRFDALGYFLLLGELTVPAIAEQLPQAQVVSHLIAESNGVLKPVAASAKGPCDPSEMFHGDAFKDAWGWAKIYAELVQLVPESVASVTVVLDALHGSILAFSVGVTELDQRLETHYGHDGPGKKIRFRVKVEMRDQLPNALVDCGWIAGTAFPPKGPIQGVSVHWFWDNLSNHGSINCGSACPSVGSNGLSIDATGPDGIATMSFTPKQEENPGEGWVVQETGVVTGVALYQSKFTNLLGAYGQYLTPKSGATRWVVEWHEAPGWTVTMTVDYNVRSTWKHIGFDAAADYFQETANGSGQMTFRVHIPAEAVNNSGKQAAPSTAKGQGSGNYTTIDYTQYKAYWHWVWDCTTAFNGEWWSVLMIDEIFSDNAGTRYVKPGSQMLPYEITTTSGTHSGGADCDAQKRLIVESAIIQKNIPTFKLDQSGPQYYTANQDAVCAAIRAEVIKYWHEIPAQPGVSAGCTANVNWTIDVRWGQPSE
jgi:hypothetical protein